LPANFVKLKLDCFWI